MADYEILMSVASIRLLSVGECLAVRLCFNRTASYDIDCMLDPNVAAVQDYLQEFEQGVLATATEGGLSDDWLNQQVELFIARSRRLALFLQSVEQDMPVFQGENLVIYAGKLEWALERKIRRVAHARDRRGTKDVDVPDATALLRLMRSRGGPLMTFEHVRGLNFNGFDVPPTHDAIREVADFYVKTYGEVGIADTEWDANEGRAKYRDINGDLVWYESKE